MKRRLDTSAPIPLPAIVHWKVDHYAALIKQVGDSYLVKDPTFGDDLLITAAALNAESSGYFLLPAEPVPAGWTDVALDEAKKIWGKGLDNKSNPNAQGPGNDGTPPNGPGGPGGPGGPPCPGMARSSVYLMLVSLSLVDTPVGYTPPRGPAVYFTARYNQRDVFQPTSFTYSHLGPKWTFDWLSYITDSGPAIEEPSVNRYQAGGGVKVSSNYNPTNQTYAPDLTGSGLVRTGPDSYERRNPDGSKEIYDYPDGTVSGPRKVFLTKIIDARGQELSYTYNNNRLIAVTDALGQVTTIQHASDTIGNAGYYRIVGVTDPYGRSATFEYNSVGRLKKITDTIGITSEFLYGSNDFINTLITPYGTTVFEAGETAEGFDHMRWCETTDPQGAKERVEMWRNKVGFGAGEPAPTGFTSVYLNFRNTFFWNKKQMMEGAGDYSKATVYHWLHSYNGYDGTSGIKESMKQPLENRVWFSYPGQYSQWTAGLKQQPSKIARVLDNGHSQIVQMDYNDLNNVTKTVDPLGRTTVYEYATNQVDLLRVKQKNGSNYEQLAAYTYNSQHLPLTVTDASGQVTTFGYNSDGQITSTDYPGTALSNTTYVYDDAPKIMCSLPGSPA
jgi:YD repeat-containing protein